MIIIAVDDEKIALESLTDSIKEADPEALVYRFANPTIALEYVRENPCDVAFLDIQMFSMDGIELGRQLKLLRPSINIIFTTGYSEYMYDAFQMHASGYILKPVTPEKVRRELEALRHPVAAAKSRVRLRCFGNFEVFVYGKPLNFKYEKTREILAYLTDRAGAMCTTREIMTALFGDGDHSSYMRNLRKNLLDTLKEVGCEDILNNEWGKMGIVTDKVECDYYQWKQGKAEGINAYHGEYMTQYSWAETTNANLYQTKD